jgi:hypothetical protein
MFRRALILTAAALAVAAPTASATIIPYVNAVAPECDSAGRDTGSHVVLYGYRKTDPASDPTVISIGPSNFNYPDPEDRGQPTHFDHDQQDYAFGAKFGAGEVAPWWGLLGNYPTGQHVRSDGTIDKTLTLTCTQPVTFAAPPNVTGGPSVGHLLTATTGRLGGTPAPEASVQWQRQAGDSWQDIDGATDRTYSPTADDAGAALRVSVTIKNGIGDDATAESAPTQPVGREPGKVTLPAIAGTPQVGQDLTTDGGQWSGTPAPAAKVLRWERCGAVDCKGISGTSGARSYHVVAADAGKTLRVVARATSSAGSTQPMTSRETAVVAK